MRDLIFQCEKSEKKGMRKKHGQSMVRSLGKDLVSSPEDAVIGTVFLFLQKEKSKLNISDVFSFFLKENYCSWMVVFWFCC